MNWSIYNKLDFVWLPTQLKKKKTVILFHRNLNIQQMRDRKRDLLFYKADQLAGMLTDLGWAREVDAVDLKIVHLAPDSSSGPKKAR